MARMLLTRSAALLPLLACLLATACAPAAPGGIAAGDTRTCDSEERVMLDCSSEVSYQGVSGEAGISVMQIASAKGTFEEKAIRRVNEEVAKFVAAQTRACRDYNACVLTRDEYRAEATDTRRRMMIIPALTKALESAKTEPERTRALDQLYRGMVPDEKRVEEITFRMAMVASIPQALGGGTFSVPPGGEAPTGATVYFTLDVSRDAYVYMFQLTPRGELSVLFPHPQIGTQNPLRGGVTSRLPGAKAFRINEQDVGTEKIYIVVSGKPIPDLAVALDKVRGGQVSTLAQSQALQAVAMVEAPRSNKPCRTRALVLDEPSGECTRTRALVLDDDETGPAPRVGGVPPAMQVRTQPADDLIVTVFPFEHLTGQAYAQRRSAGGDTRRTRGILIED